MTDKKMTSFCAGCLYAFIHFSIEVACFYFLFSRISATPSWWILALLFDALAFLTQGIFGCISDKYQKIPFGLIGCGLVLFALILPLDIFALIAIGLGNALLHIDGAQHTLRNSKAKITPNAVFVGGGSFGVVTGQILGGLGVKWGLLIPICCMLVSALLVGVIYKNHSLRIEESPTHIPLNVVSDISDFAVVLFIIFAVAIRSYLAYAIPIEWNKTVWQTVLLFSFMGTGKALGGVLVDKIGFRKTAYISVIFALPFLLFGNAVMVVSLVGVLLFSMTMPVTVGVLLSKFPTMPGFAFGVTTVGLFFGVLPQFFFALPNLFIHRIVVFGLSIIALPLILSCLKRRK